MGPRPFGRGRWLRTVGGSAWFIGFNGAATFRSRKVDVEADNMAFYVASMGPRPFGRGRFHIRPVWDVWGEASMGPRPFGRGRAEAAGGAGAGYLSFNGAATFRSRKVEREMIGKPQSRRFNGAATFRSRKAHPARSSGPSAPCFNGAATFRSRKAAFPVLGQSLLDIQLQWGRDLSVAEGWGAMSERRTARYRLQWGRDLSVAEGQ